MHWWVVVLAGLCSILLTCLHMVPKPIVLTLMYIRYENPLQEGDGSPVSNIMNCLQL